MIFLSSVFAVVPSLSLEGNIYFISFESTKINHFIKGKMYEKLQTSKSETMRFEKIIS